MKKLRLLTFLLTAGWLALVTSPPSHAAATMEEEFKIKRQGPFEFAEKPTVAKQGDTVTIRFKTKALCDVTVAIEDTEGRIIRHLASGVLGKNAPVPFQKDSLEQTLIWDSKDEQGRYYDDTDNVVIRVSLGLRARFERHHLWSPYRRVSNQGPFATLNGSGAFVAQPEGVYVFDGQMTDHLRLFDHAGNYLRTVYPFPTKQRDKLDGVQMQRFPQSGQVLPRKGGNYSSTLLTSGTNVEGGYNSQRYGLAATAMAVRSGRIALVANYLNRLATDGSTGGLPLQGPETRSGGHLPRSAALSPDGKTLYLTGYSHTPGSEWFHQRIPWQHVVRRIDFETGDKMQDFVVGKGTEPGKFRTPLSVDTDAQGRVYVADRFNHRIQIFDPSGKHLKSVPVNLPSEVSIDQRNGDI
jgi:hypothetical protein